MNEWNAERTSGYNVIILETINESGVENDSVSESIQALTIGNG